MASKDVEFIKEPTVNIMSPCCLSLINIIIIIISFSLFFPIELIVKFIMQFFNKAMEGSSDVYFDSLQESYMKQIALSRCMNFDKQEGILCSKLQLQFRVWSW
jgi:hypothetical protein